MERGCDGSFLVRHSTSNPGDLTLSVRYVEQNNYGMRAFYKIFSRIIDIIVLFCLKCSIRKLALPLVHRDAVRQTSVKFKLHRVISVASQIRKLFVGDFNVLFLNFPAAAVNGKV